MKHIKTLSTRRPEGIHEEGRMRESARHPASLHARTSCTVGNQSCEKMK